jgi:hypothetical protein
MSVKVIVNARGVRELLKLDPEPIAELAHNAVAHIVNEIERDIWTKALTDAMKKRFDILMLSDRSWPQSLNEPTRKLIADGIHKEAAHLRERLQSTALREAIEKEMRFFFEANKATLLSGIESKIDALITQRFAKMFGGAQLNAPTD